MFNKSSEKLCPLIRKPCLKHGCEYYVSIRGRNPQTGEEVDGWDCVNKWIPLLLIENSQQQRQTGAAVESFRNEMIKSSETNLRVALTTSQGNIKLIGG